MTVAATPSVNPNITWLTLCTPKYVLENGTKNPNIIKNIHAVL